jgi:hypothetical protein
MSIETLTELYQKAQALQQELEAEIDHLLAEKRAQFQYEFRRGRVYFEENILAWQHQQRIPLWLYLKTARLAILLTAPLIYGVLIPMLLLDMAVTLYQQVCFRVYGIPLVRRSDYFIIDRHHLAYLNVLEKLNCMYCSYGNSLVEYVREISARTEQYWCPIKHARRSPDPHRLTQQFVDYGDAQAYQQRLEALRKAFEERGP